jgi:hypothetical protein
MAETVRFSDLQDDLNTRGYAGLINLIIIRGTQYTTGSFSAGTKVPSLYPAALGLTNLAVEAVLTPPLGWHRAVILDKSGNHSENFRIYPGYTYTLTSQTDYETIRGKLIARAHADGLFPPAAIVAEPNGGESLPRGTTQTIEWSHAGIGGNVAIDLLKGGALYSNIVASTTNDGSHAWSIPLNHVTATDFRIRVTPSLAPEKSDQSNADFSIYDPVLTVVSPNGGEALPRGAANEIIWTDTGIGGNVAIDLLKGGSLQSSIVASTSNDGSYAWFTPAAQALGSDYKIRITPANDPAKVDASDNNFTINTPIYAINMESDPGWTFTGEWGWGVPSITEAYYTPPVPPTSAHSGTKAIGYDIDGCYAAGMPSTEWATSPTIDCTYRTNVTLAFWRYAGTYTGDQVHLQAKNGTGTWQTVWSSSSQLNIGYWQYVSYNISAIADRKAGVQIRFGLGPTTSTYYFCGLYVDDLAVRGNIAATTNGTPYSWLATHGITNNQESADLLDSDGDGAYNWQEYLAGTDPTNAASVFAVSRIFYTGTSNAITWYGTTNSGVSSDFIVYRTTNIMNSIWLPVGTNSRNATGTNTWWDPNPPSIGPVFYRPALP